MRLASLCIVDWVESEVDSVDWVGFRERIENKLSLPDQIQQNEDDYLSSSTLSHRRIRQPGMFASGLAICSLEAEATVKADRRSRSASF